LVEAGILILGEAETDASATRWHQPKHIIPSAKPDSVGYVLLGARSGGYNVRRDRFVVP
jgi:hypothetical protein